jgi:hypothetical protein
MNRCARRAAIALFALTCTPSPARAGEWILLAGLAQPLLFEGGNVAVTYITNGGLVLDYSHGWAFQLDATPSALAEAERAQKLRVYLPYTTGFGIGHLVADNLDFRLEFKVHRYEVTHPGGAQISYTTRSAGVGAYYRYRFGRSRWLLEPSVRYWPNVSSTLDDDRHTFPNGDVHEAHDQGLFANVSLGYAF